jgi:hypothetical protein
MKATKAQTQARVDELVRALLAGAKPTDIREYVSERAKDSASPWFVAEGRKPLSDKQLFNLARKAGEVIGASTREKRRKRIERHVAQRQYLYAQAVAANDYRTALAILDSEAKLFGLDNVELRKEVAELRRQLAEAKKNAHTPATGEGAAGGDRGAGEAPGKPGAGAAAG